MAYYFPGSTRDRQSRLAVVAQDRGQWDTPLPLLSTAGEVAPVGQRSLELPPRAAARQRDYTWLQWLELPVFGEIPVGRQSTDNLPPRAAARSRDYSYVDPTEIWLISQDAINPGQQFTDLPPRGQARSRDYTFVASLDNRLIGTDAMVSGQQFTANPPRAPQRCSQLSDPGVNLTLALSAGGPVGLSTFGTDLPPRAAARSRDYSYTDSFFAGLIGADAVNPGQQVGNDLPPRASARARDYTWLQSLALNVYGELPFGQTTLATELPPRAPRRGADLSTPYNLTVWLDLASQAVQAPGKSTDQTILPPRGPARSRDYTFAYPAQVQLFGQDALVTGQQSFELPPRGRQRAATLSDPGYNLTVWLDLAAQAVQGPGQSTARTDLPPRAAQRLRDYSFTAWTFLALIGADALVTGTQSTALPPRGPQRAASLYDPLFNFTLYNDTSTNPPLPVGEQFTESPPRGAPRSKDYSWLNRLPNLIGQDSFNPGKSTDATALPPRGPARSKDYTWLQSLPLHIYQQIPPGESTLSTEGPPRGPLRLKDYSFLHLTDTQLIGQDSMTAGQSWLDTDNLPPRAYQRLRDYTWLQRFSLPELVATTHAGHHTLADRALFIHSLSDRARFAHTLTDRELYAHVLTDQEQSL